MLAPLSRDRQRLRARTGWLGAGEVQGGPLGVHGSVDTRPHCQKHRWWGGGLGLPVPRSPGCDPFRKHQLPERCLLPISSADTHPHRGAWGRIIIIIFFGTPVITIIIIIIILTLTHYKYTVRYFKKQERHLAFPATLYTADSVPSRLKRTGRSEVWAEAWLRLVGTRRHSPDHPWGSFLQDPGSH